MTSDNSSFIVPPIVVRSRKFNFLPTFKHTGHTREINLHLARGRLFCYHRNLSKMDELSGNRLRRYYVIKITSIDESAAAIGDY